MGVVVVEGTLGGWDVAEVLVDQTTTTGSEGRSARTGRIGRGLVTKSRIARSSTVFAALGHPVRVGLLVRLLDGPATYQELQAHSRLAAGPLYHHVNQLRMAGLILPKKRDTYAMTRGGRNAILVGLAITPMTADRRARPTVMA